MRGYSFPILAFALFCALPLYADPVPYPFVGTPAAVSMMKATGTSIGIYYFSSAANGTDLINISDQNTGSSTGFIFNNKTTSTGTLVTLSGVAVGDVIVASIKNQSAGGLVFSSLPSASADGQNHAYITPFTAADTMAGIPVGTYIGFEDFYIPPSDLDYNDETVVLTGVSATAATPEPSSIIMLGSGVVGLAGFVRSKRHRTAESA